MEFVINVVAISTTKRKGRRRSRKAMLSQKFEEGSTMKTISVLPLWRLMLVGKYS